MKEKKMTNQSGQMLIPLLIFMVIAVMIITGAIIVMGIDTTTASSLQQSSLALNNAETGAENAVLRLLRDPAYTGEVMTFPQQGSAQIAVVGTDTFIATSSGRMGNFLRKIEVHMQYDTGKLTVTSWREIP